MSAANLLSFSARFQALSPIFANGFQHHESRLVSRLFSLLQQTVVEEGRYSIQRYSVLLTAYRFHRLESTAAHKDGESAEQVLLIGRQELIAPLDGTPQGQLPCRKIPGST